MIISDRYKAWVVVRYNNGEPPKITVFGNPEAASKYAIDCIDKFDHVFYEICPVFGKYLVGDETNE